MKQITQESQNDNHLNRRENCIMIKELSILKMMVLFPLSRKREQKIIPLKT
ncbi:hypothetical protein DDD_1949 [Nonlabens dokdonensis DSW-6]|uniref:Uncharacterized protein n=1 Tax=Nonlabens dokdonensis (strain DSM 17205 / KCTC 12402 / DSW-6) TaxID=592029 RepID=L7WB08_NONDD|nr:hypothetical protein DDD_1949 [Nonlabens dokdonensis DSW-6]